MRFVVVALLLGACASPATAMHIVLTNDDGFESGNTQALFNGLKAAGHEVILSAPYYNMSGTSALMTGITDHTTAASPGGKIAAGSPGVGPTTIATDQYYVDATPAASVLYGIDVLAKAKWGRPPDLVISGPNAGNNLGTVIPYSGTVGAAISALNRGVPAIAVSGANGDPAAAALLAQITLRVLEAAEVHGQIALPPLTGLNVNVPSLDLKRNAAAYRIAFTQISNEGSVFASGDSVTVSPIQGTYQAASDATAGVLTQMRALFSSVSPIANPELINISVRGLVGTESNVLVAGFVVSGSSPKTVLIRASGPSLASFGVSGTLEDPTLDVLTGSDRAQRVVATNDNWSDDSTLAEMIATTANKLGAFPWKLGSKDAALLVTLDPGTYTAVVRGANRGTGVGLLEVYDAGNN